MTTSIPDSWFRHKKKLRARLMDPSGRRVDRIIQVRDQSHLRSDQPNYLQPGE